MPVVKSSLRTVYFPIPGDSYCVLNSQASLRMGQGTGLLTHHECPRDERLWYSTGEHKLCMVQNRYLLLGEVQQYIQQQGRVTSGAPAAALRHLLLLSAPKLSAEQFVT